MPVALAYRNPSPEEFAAVTRAVGFRAHPLEAIRIGLANSWCAVCATADGEVVGIGRVVGDGALHFYITGIMVVPAHQGRGIGSAIVRALLARVRTVAYRNVLVEALPLPDLEAFYARFGFTSSRRPAPGMHLWLNSAAPDAAHRGAHEGGTSMSTMMDATFCFVDIAGYTALTYTHGEAAAADLVDEFAGLVRAAIGSTGELQSLIGDCAFLIFPEPVAATRALVSLYRCVADRQNFPVVRAGLHHGPALLRGDRHFGSTVNIAARVAAQAIGGQALCTGVVAQLLASAGVPDVEVEHHGLASLKNVPEPMDLYELVLPGSARQYAIDPVCKMQVDKRRAAGDLHYNGTTHWFCSLLCVERFAKDPSSYVPS